MTEKDLAELARLTRDLQRNTPKAVKDAPKLSMQNIRKKSVEVPTEVGDVNGVKFLQDDILTNDVLYADIAFDMTSLKPELLPLVPLFCRSLLETGTKNLNSVQLNQLTGEETGGISVYPYTSSKQGSLDPVSHIMVRCKAMSANTEDLFNLITCVLKEADFTNQKRFKRFVSQSIAKSENQLKDAGHVLVSSRLYAKLNHAGWIGDKGYSSFLRYLSGVSEEDRQARREEVLSTRLSDFNEFAGVVDDIKEKGVIVVVVASEHDVDSANKERSDLFQVKKAL